MEKPLSEITRKDWIAYQWVEVSMEFGNERYFMQGHNRTPDEALRAMEEWDVTAEERGVEEAEVVVQ